MRAPCVIATTSTGTSFAPDRSTMKRLSTIVALVGSLTMAGAFGVACSHNKRVAPDRSTALQPPLGTSTAMGPSDPTLELEVPQQEAPPLEHVPTLSPSTESGSPATLPAPTSAETVEPPSPSPTSPPTTNATQQPITTVPVPAPTAPPVPSQPAEPPRGNQPVAPTPPPPTTPAPQPSPTPPTTPGPAPSTPPSMMPMQARMDGGIAPPPPPPAGPDAGPITSPRDAGGSPTPPGIRTDGGFRP
jgi:hypothetical protein